MVTRSEARERAAIMRMINTPISPFWGNKKANKYRAAKKAHSKGVSAQQISDAFIQSDRDSKASKRTSAGISARGVQQNFNNPVFSVKTPAMPNSSNPNNTPTARVTSTDAATAKANAEQTAYVASLRAGGVGVAEALLKPRTTQTYYKNGKQVSKSETSINLEKFLTERGYDISKPELIPNSVFKAEKQFAARKQARSKGAMGDLNKVANTYPKTSPQVLAKRAAIKEQFKPQFINLNKPAFGPTKTPIQKANDIENFGLMPNRPINLDQLRPPQVLVSGQPTPQGMKTMGDVYSPVELFLGSFVKGSRNTFDSYGNQITNVGNFLTGKPQQPLARPPIQDSFFGALGDSAKNTIYGDKIRQQEQRPKDPLGDFWKTQQKREPGTIAGELFTEGLFWAIPVAPAAKGASAVAKFFKGSTKTVKQTKKSKAWQSEKDFFKSEGKTKDITFGDQFNSFFKGKTPKKEPIPQTPFITKSVNLGKGTTKGKDNNFFGGSTKKGGFFGGSTGKKPTNPFYEKPTKGGQIVLTKQKPIAKTTFKSYPVQLGKSKVKQQFKPIAKLKPLTKQKQKLQPLFVFPRPKQLVKPKQPQRQKQQDFFAMPRPKQGVKQKAITTTRQSQKRRTTPGLITPFFPTTTTTTPIPPIFRFWGSGGGAAFGRRNRLRHGRKAYTAWNVNTNYVGGFLKGPSYKKSYGQGIFKDLDRKTKKAKKKEKSEWLDFFS